MTAQKSLSNLIKILTLFFIFATPAFALIEYVIEDFEDVSDWACTVDCGSFTTSTTQVHDGTYSGKIVVDSTSNEEASVFRSGFSAPNVSASPHLLFWYWIDENDFAYNDIGEITVVCSCGYCADFFPTKADTLDEQWSLMNISLSECYTGIPDELISIEIRPLTMDAPSVPFNIYIDTMTLWLEDTCYPTDNWVISNGDACSINFAQTVSTLNISNGSLEIKASGNLSVTSGYVYIYPQSNLTILSGGQIHG